MSYGGTPPGVGEPRPGPGRGGRLREWHRRGGNARAQPGAAPGCRLGAGRCRRRDALCTVRPPGNRQDRHSRRVCPTGKMCSPLIAVKPLRIGRTAPLLTVPYRSAPAFSTDNEHKLFPNTCYLAPGKSARASSLLTVPSRSAQAFSLNFNIHYSPFPANQPPGIGKSIILVDCALSPPPLFSRV